MFEACYFKIKTEEYTSKLVPIMPGLGEILESSSIYFSSKLNLTVIETQGNDIKSRITQAEAYLKKNKINYSTENATAKSPFELKHI